MNQRTVFSILIILSSSSIFTHENNAKNQKLLEQSLVKLCFPFSNLYKMLGDYGSNLETQICGVEAIGRLQKKDEAFSLLLIFQTKLAILRQKDIVFLFLHQSQVVFSNLPSYFSPDENKWDNRFQQIQQTIIAA